MTLTLVWFVAPAHAQDAPHFPHDARFGGLFMASADDRLHFEGIWSSQRRFKLLVSDSSGSPLPIERLREIQGTVVTGNQQSALTLLESDGYFEARIPTLPLPATIAVAIRTAGNSVEERLAFSFADYSVDTSNDTTAPPVEIPSSRRGILSALRDAQRNATTLVASGDLVGLADPEQRIRELTLALKPYLADLPEEHRRRAETARVAGIRAAWLLHVSFDYGSEIQARAAVDKVIAAVDEVIGAWSLAP